jgi:ATP-dependent DNA ligase
LIRRAAKWSKSFLRVSRQASLDVEGIVSKKLDAPYKSEPSKAWLKIKNPKAPAATRKIEGTF